MKATKRDMVRALADVYNEGLAGDFWSEENQGEKGWWSKDMPETAEVDGDRLRIGKFLVRVIIRQRSRDANARKGVDHGKA